MSPMIARAARIAFALALVAIVAAIVARPSVPAGHGTESRVLGTKLVGNGVNATEAGQEKTNGRDKKNFTISGDVTGLYPGAQTSLVLTVHNPNNFAIQVESLTVAVRAPSASGCPASAVSIPNFSGALLVPRDGTATQALAVTMSSNAPDECQNATFPLEYSGTAVKP